MAWSWNVGDIAEVTFEGVLFGQVTMTVLRYRLKTAGLSGGKEASDDLEAKLIDVGEVWNLYIKCLSSDWHATGNTIQRIHDTRMRAYFYDLSDPGDINVSANTANTAAVITTFTELSTKRSEEKHEGQTGALHLPAIPWDRYVDGLLTNAYIGGPILDLTEKLPAPIVTAGGNTWQLIIYHPKGTTKVFDDVVGAFGQRTMRTMRRRTVGRGI